MSARGARAAGRASARGAATPSRAWLDAVLILAGWTLLASWVGRGQLVVAYDTFRDMAYTHAILRGELGKDPTLPGLTAWYPAATSLLFAAVSRLTGASVVTVHGTSIYWSGWLLPLAVHLLVRRAFGRAAAWWSLAMVGLGSYWWLTHLAMPMPSIQGIVPGALTLWAWLGARGRGWPAAVGVGALGSLAVAFHPICGGMAMSAVLLHGLLGVAFARGDKRGAARVAAWQALIAFATWTLIAAAILWPLLEGPLLNPAPRHWFAPELRDPRHALHAHAPLVLAFGLAGLLRAAAAWERAGWLAAYAAISLVGTLAGYGAVVLGWPIPYLLPHEFQWHLQLAWCIAAALAMLDLARHLGERWSHGPARRRIPTAVLAALVLGPALPHLPESRSQLMVLDATWAPARSFARALEARGPAGAVIATEPEIGYYLSGFSGTRAILLPGGHMNPRADLSARLTTLRGLMQAEDESAFVEALRRARVDYLLHAPADTVQYRRLVQRYARWSIVEPVPLAASTLLLYSVRDDTSRAMTRAR